MNKTIICPYKEQNRKICTHRCTKKNRGGKRTCNYNYPHNCELFIEWIEKSKKIKTMGRNTSENTIEDEGYYDIL